MKNAIQITDILNYAPVHKEINDMETSMVSGVSTVLRRGRKSRKQRLNDKETSVPKIIPSLVIDSKKIVLKN